MIDTKTFLMKVLQVQNPALLEKAEKCAECAHFPKGAFIVRQGEPIGAYRFLISEGIIRCVYHTTAGKEITECFVSGVGNCAMPSAVLDEPSPIDMEALTEVELICFPIETVKTLEKEYPEILAMENKVLTQTWREQWELKRIHYELSAKERYQWFVERYPNVVNHVHDKYIASFLDMSPVTLSRIKGSFLRD